MPRKPEDRREDTPRTDLPPVKEPTYKGHFGTDEEEGVVREDESGDEEIRDEGADPGADESVNPDASSAAGGDREIM